MKVILTGTRDFRDAVSVEKAVKQIVSLNPEGQPLVIVHFATNLVDGYVDAICKLNGISVNERQPDWRAHGKSALYRLVDTYVPEADLVVWCGSDAVSGHAATVATGNNVRFLTVEAAKPTVEVMELV